MWNKRSLPTQQAPDLQTKLEISLWVAVDLMSLTGVPGQTKLRYCRRTQVTGRLQPNHSLISDVPVLHWDYKWEERIPDPGREGIKWSALEQGTHSSLSAGLTGRGSLVVWCEMQNKGREEIRVCAEQCVCVRKYTLGFPDVLIPGSSGQYWLNHASPFFGKENGGRVVLPCEGFTCVITKV